MQGTAPDVAATDQPSAPEAQQSVPDADEPARNRETAPAGPASPESTEPSDEAAAGDAEADSPADEQRLADELAREHGARMGQGLDRLRETGDPQEPTDAELSLAQALIDGVATPYSAANGGAARSVADPLATWRPSFGVQGMDVSSHQPSVNWAQQYSAGARFAYVKATEGDSYRNPLFTDQYNGASNAGMFRGAYHFAIPTPNSSGAAQANYFINNGGGWTADGRTLPPLLDIEYNPYSQYGNTCYNFTPAQMVSWIRDFSNTVKARTGRVPMIYTTADWWNRCTGNSTAFADHPLHIARYSTAGAGTMPAGWGDYTVWQYSSTGPFPGDSNVFKGSYDELSWFVRNQVPDRAHRVFSPGDLNGDGVGDLVARRSDGTLWLSPGTGNGRFGTPVRIGQGWNIYNLFIGTGDYDGDGRNDFLARHIDGSLWLYSGTGVVNTGAGQEGYKPARKIGTQGWEAFNAIIGPGDVDGNGRADLLARTRDGRVLLYSGTGNGGHGSSRQIGSGWNEYTQMVGVRDFDGDKRNDVLVRVGDGRLRLLKGDGRGGFAPGPWIGQGWNIFAEIHGGADFNRDGKPDLVGRAANQALTFYAGTGTISEGYKAGTPSASRGIVRGASVISVSDFNSDKRPDLLSVRPDGTLWFHRGTGNGRHADPVRIGSGWNMYSEVISPGDFNGDGRADLIARAPDGGLWFYAGTGQVGGGNEGYRPAARIGSGWNIYTQLLGTGDLTGDGRADLVARHVDGSLWRYDGTGKVSGSNEGYGRAVRIGTGGWAGLSLTAPGDFDGNGTRDLLARDPSGTLLLYRGTGRGTLTSPEAAGSAWNTFTHLLGTGDTTADGIGDLLAVTPDGATWHYPGTGLKSEGYRPAAAAGNL